MKKSFTVPVIYTTSGWITILADDLESAKKEATRLNDEGVEYFSIEDCQYESEVIVDELEENK